MTEAEGDYVQMPTFFIILGGLLLAAWSVAAIFNHKGDVAAWFNRMEGDQ